MLDTHTLKNQPPRSNRYCIRALIVALAGGDDGGGDGVEKREHSRECFRVRERSRTEHLRGSSVRLKYLYTSAGDPSDPKMRLASTYILGIYVRRKY